ncbi:MAG: hypothetical protein IIC78_03895 [Chloroflexi bacterium]|nr:hypothetical protein [Chloroflexota bacterium]
MSDHPNILLAANRFRRIAFAWAGLSALVGLITLRMLSGSFPLAAVPWFICTLLLVSIQQPSGMALVTVLWGTSLLHLLPGVAALFGPDPLTLMFEVSTIEKIAFAVVRILLLLMAWNQFMFYRMLYGTSYFSGLPKDSPVIPEVIRNRNDSLARIALWLGVVSLLAVWGAGLIGVQEMALRLIAFAYICVLLSIGLGLGAVFSPTNRRRDALSAIGFGFISFLSMLVVARFVIL